MKLTYYEDLLKWDYDKDTDWRTARELLDESFGEIMKLINQALSVGKRGGVSKKSFNQMADKLQNQWPLTGVWGLLELHLIMRKVKTTPIKRSG